MKPEPIFLFFIMYGIHTLSSSMKLEIYVDLHAFSLEFQAELGFKSKKQKKKERKKILSDQRNFFTTFLNFIKNGNILYFCG